MDLARRDELIEEAVGTVEDLVAAGADEDRAIALVADFADAIIPFDVLIPGPVGELAEAHDGEAIDWLINKVRVLLRVDPDKREARQARREERRTARKAKRAAHKAE